MSNDGSIERVITFARLRKQGKYPNADIQGENGNISVRVKINVIRPESFITLDVRSARLLAKRLIQVADWMRKSGGGKRHE
jgi:hypothetical protein